MTTSELITPLHLARKALIYIRQSTLQQVLTNQESLRLQYALRLKALELGWQTDDIQIIDTDLGQTAAVAQNREGFKEVISRVTLGEIGILLSSEVTRLSRNCSDWYPLLDICGYRHCLIADRDGVYDPASSNGRLLLGLKGQLSEFELHTIRSRLTAGLQQSSARRSRVSPPDRPVAPAGWTGGQRPQPGSSGAHRACIHYLPESKIRLQGITLLQRTAPGFTPSRSLRCFDLERSLDRRTLVDFEEPRLCRCFCLWPHYYSA